MLTTATCDSSSAWPTIRSACIQLNGDAPVTVGRMASAHPAALLGEPANSVLVGAARLPPPHEQPAALDRLRAAAAPTSRAYVSRFRRPVDALRSLAGHELALRLAASTAAAAVGGAALEISHDDRGRPCLLASNAPAPGGVDVSVSHHGGWVAAAVTAPAAAGGPQSSVGIDVICTDDAPAAGPSFDAAFGGYLSAAEMALLEHLVTVAASSDAAARSRAAAFGVLWSLKEAVAKVRTLAARRTRGWYGWDGCTMNDSGTPLLGPHHLLTRRRAAATASAPPPLRAPASTSARWASLQRGRRTTRWGVPAWCWSRRCRHTAARGSAREWRRDGASLRRWWV